MLVASLWLFIFRLTNMVSELGPEATLPSWTRVPWNQVRCPNEPFLCSPRPWTTHFPKLWILSGSWPPSFLVEVSAFPWDQRGKLPQLGIAMGTSVPVPVWCCHRSLLPYEEFSSGWASFMLVRSSLVLSSSQGFFPPGGWVWIFVACSFLCLCLCCLS